MSLRCDLNEKHGEYFLQDSRMPLQCDLYVERGEFSLQDSHMQLRLDLNAEYGGILSKILRYFSGEICKRKTERAIIG